jgi:hypothetical protein
LIPPAVGQVRLENQAVAWLKVYDFFFDLIGERSFQAENKLVSGVDNQVEHSPSNF